MEHSLPDLDVSYRNALFNLPGASIGQSLANGIHRAVNSCRVVNEHRAFYTTTLYRDRALQVVMLKFRER